MSAYLSPVFGAGAQLFNNQGVVLSGGKLYTYLAGTTTPQQTWTTSAQSVANANPLIMDSSGRVSSEIWLTGGVTYKFVLTDSAGGAIGTWDYISGVNDNTAQTSLSGEWVPSGLTPTYVSSGFQGNVLSFPGDVTQTFFPGRQVVASTIGGLAYGYVQSSSFASVTTVTIVPNSGGIIDSTVFAVAVAALGSYKPSIPQNVLPPNNTLTFRNKIINGDFRIWQRGTSRVNPANAAQSFLADRWQAFRAGFATGLTVSKVTGTGLIGFNNAIRLQRTAADASTAAISLGQTVETASSLEFNGNQYCLSFWARKGADFSGSQITTTAFWGTGTDENGVTGTFTGSSLWNVMTNIQPSTSWQRFRLYNYNVQTAINEVSFTISYSPSGTAGANDYLDITGVQLEIGNYASNFEQIPNEVLLAQCQRFFNSYGGNSISDSVSNASVTTTSTAVGVINFPVEMRTTPTFSVSANADWAIKTGVVLNTVSGLSLNVDGTKSAALVWSTGATLTVGQAAFIVANNTANARLFLSSEM